MIINHENTSDESEVSDSSTNAKTSFRVSVCLRRYFKDHRARCYMQVTRNRRVRWLEKRIRKVFSISQMFCLCSNGHLLPSTEPLALLDPGDSIEVIPLKETQEKDLNVRNGCLSGTIVMSDTTEQIFTDKATPFSYDISQNNSLIMDKESIQQNCGNVLDKNNTNLNSSNKNNQNVEKMSDNMETERPEFTSSFDNQKNIDRQTTYDEADSAMNILQQMKQQALQLFEGECGATSSEPRRRVRRRVRRRTRTTALPAAPLLAPPVASSPHPPHLRFSSPPPGSRTLSPIPEPRCSSPLEVSRNEEVSARLPRVIRPLGIDD